MCCRHNSDFFQSVLTAINANIPFGLRGWRIVILLNNLTNRTFAQMKNSCFVLNKSRQIAHRVAELNKMC